MGTKQRNGSEFDQASALPYRYHDGRLEFCLITSLSKRRWIFPKGYIDPGESPSDTALKEAEEEAGLRGRIVDLPLGTYHRFKWGRSLRVIVLLMEVSDVAGRWEDSAVRERRWVGFSEAAELLSGRRLHPFLVEAAQRLETDAVLRCAQHGAA
jgi:8-oxo-dGTP pyrophosphatase MutT (NUDIX family)